MEDHRSNNPVTPHGPGGGLAPHGRARGLAPHGGGDALAPHGPGSGLGTGDHGDLGPLVPAGLTLLATDPQPGTMLLSTEQGEVFSVKVE